MKKYVQLLVEKKNDSGTCRFPTALYLYAGEDIAAARTALHTHCSYTSDPCYQISSEIITLDPQKDSDIRFFWDCLKECRILTPLMGNEEHRAYFYGS